MAKPKQTRTKRTKKVVEAEGIAHIKATFNNTLITIAVTEEGPQVLTGVVPQGYEVLPAPVPEPSGTP